MNVADWITRWASWTPAKTALQFEGREIAYAELDREIGSLAAWLSDHGVSPGDRVAYLGMNCPELIGLLFACARLGAIFVPLNARMPPPELRVFVELTRPRLLVAERDLRQVALDSARPLESDRVRTFEIGGASSDRAPGARRLPARSEVSRAAPVVILFTSGTTGRPKGATFTHENLAFNAINGITAFGLTAADEILTAVPMFHAGGLFIHTLPGLCAGATITVHRRFDPEQMLEEIPRRRIALLASVPAMTSALVAHPAWDNADLSSLRLVITGSTVVPRRALEAWRRRGVPITQGYGSTEATPVATTMPPGSAPDTAFTAGKPTLYTELRIVDEAGDDAPTGAPGEVWIRGPAVMQGYWQNEQATREAFCGGWLRTGDIGVIDGHGCLHIVDRIKDIIIVGGSNVYPSDLEAVLDSSPDVREAAVVGRRDDELGEVPVACVSLMPGRTLAEGAILALFEHRLARYKHPRAVIFLNALPRNATGKVDRARLREAANAHPDAAGAAPRLASSSPSIEPDNARD